MFMNLTARKDNGDFYITSSEVEQEKHPELDAAGLALHMQMTAGMMLTQGWNVELTKDDGDITDTYYGA